MKIAEIRQEADLYELKDSWDRLLVQSGSNTIFLSWEWVSSWWRSYGRPGELLILTATDDTGTVRGIAPLRIHTISAYGQTYSALKFLGDGSMDTDYMDFVIESGFEEPALDVFQRHCMGLQEHDGLLLLNEIPETSPNLTFLYQMAGRQGLICKEKDVPCSTVRLPENWDAYLAVLKPRFRTKVRSVLHNLEGRTDVQFRFCDSAEQLKRLLPALFDLHTARWNRAGKTGVFGFPGKREFYASLSSLLLDRNWLRFSWLEWNSRILACQYGFEYDGKYLQLQEGYEPAAEHWNVGMGLRAWSIREFLKRGLREYDFLGGVGQHKADWGSDTTTSKQILLARPSWKNRLLVSGSEWETVTKDFVKMFVPARVLALRDARQQQGSVSPTKDQQSAGVPATPWRRKLAATCYFRLGLPALTRHLRHRYQISLERGGKKKFSWSRRNRPSVRILYYHRVNEENDPFFPSISPTQFENEVRYLTRNYRVVGLDDAMNHLHSGPPETVVAITFDDGYQDNYQYAFPILQRYGLTATIFLTTGALDSRNPMWFERLAEALKLTARDFIDLEIDLPRRFRLNTQADRLQANERILSLLRGLTDEERQQWLTRIHRELGVAGDGNRKDMMLTWDQVRLMKGQEIDFGGHTVNHPFISKLSRDRVMWEASECKRRIEEELQLPVDYFAYPSGREEDFGRWNKDLIRDAGYRAAVTTIWGVNYASTDPMELRRGGPWESSVDLFAYKMDWYQLVNG